MPFLSQHQKVPAPPPGLSESSDEIDGTESMSAEEDDSDNEATSSKAFKNLRKKLDLDLA